MWGNCSIQRYSGDGDQGAREHLAVNASPIETPISARGMTWGAELACHDRAAVLLCLLHRLGAAARWLLDLKPQKRVEQPQKITQRLSARFVFHSAKRTFQKRTLVSVCAVFSPSPRTPGRSMDQVPEMPAAPAVGQQVGSLDVHAAVKAANSRKRALGGVCSRCGSDSSHSQTGLPIPSKLVCPCPQVTTRRLRKCSAERTRSGRSKSQRGVRRNAAVHAACSYAAAPNAPLPHPVPSTYYLVSPAAAHIDPQQPVQQAVQQEILRTLQTLQAEMASTNAMLGNMRRRTRNQLAKQAAPQPVPLEALCKERQPAAGGAAVGSLPPAGNFPADMSAAYSVRGTCRVSYCCNVLEYCWTACLLLFTCVTVWVCSLANCTRVCPAAHGRPAGRPGGVL